MREKDLTTTFVKVPLSRSIPEALARETFKKVAPIFEDTPGLVSKYFLLSENGETVGGFYIWRSRADANEFYNSDFLAHLKNTFGATPEITFYKAPLAIHNTRDTDRKSSSKSYVEPIPGVYISS